MADETQGEPVTSTGSWLSDVQRILALTLIWTLAFACIALTIRIAIFSPIDDALDMAKVMLAALVNMGLIALGFFFGSSKSKENADQNQQQLVNKLTSTPPGTLPPVPGAPSPWWSKLTDAEKTAITAEGPNDPRVSAIVAAMTSGSATQDDLAYLVGKNLLTQARATEIAG